MSPKPTEDELYLIELEKIAGLEPIVADDDDPESEDGFDQNVEVDR